MYMGTMHCTFVAVDLLYLYVSTNLRLAISLRPAVEQRITIHSQLIFLRSREPQPSVHDEEVLQGEEPQRPLQAHLCRLLSNVRASCIAGTLTIHRLNARTYSSEDSKERANQGKSPPKAMLRTNAIALTSVQARYRNVCVWSHPTRHGHIMAPRPPTRVRTRVYGTFQEYTRLRRRRPYGEYHVPAHAHTRALGGRTQPQRRKDA